MTKISTYHVPFCPTINEDASGVRVDSTNELEELSGIVVLGIMRGGEGLDSEFLAAMMTMGSQAKRSTGGDK